MKRKVKTSLSDIADACGVSIATVSRALNRHSGLRPEMRRKILDKAIEMEYTMSFSHRREVVTLLVPGNTEISMRGYMAQLVTAMTRSVLGKGLSIEILPFHEREYLSGKEARGVVVLTSHDAEGVLPYVQTQTPVVAVNSPLPERKNAFSVFSNEEQGIKKAFEYFFEKGHRKIGFLASGSVNSWAVKKRMEYFSCLATDYGLEFSGQVQHHNGRVDEIYEFAGKLLKKNITALLCMGETVGIPVAYALNLFGKNIPEDVSYICHELENISKFNLPPLTTLAQDFSAIGELCLDVITSYHDSHSLLKREKMVDYIFNERDSVVSV